MLAAGFGESSESWADLLRDGKRRGMRAPVLAVGDGPLGFWKAIRDVLPETAEQRCRWHKIGNVLSALPKSVHLGADTSADTLAGPRRARRPSEFGWDLRGVRVPSVRPHSRADRE